MEIETKPTPVTTEEKLISLLHPTDYMSKIKLYCRYSNFSVNKFAQVKDKYYICQIIKIKEISKN